MRISCVGSLQSLELPLLLTRIRGRRPYSPFIYFSLVYYLAHNIPCYYLSCFPMVPCWTHSLSPSYVDHPRRTLIMSNVLGPKLCLANDYA